MHMHMRITQRRHPPWFTGNVDVGFSSPAFGLSMLVRIASPMPYDECISSRKSNRGLGPKPSHAAIPASRFRSSDLERVTAFLPRIMASEAIL